jgi:hypothetical protein
MIALIGWLIFLLLFLVFWSGGRVGSLGMGWAGAMVRWRRWKRKTKESRWRGKLRVRVVKSWDSVLGQYGCKEFDDFEAECITNRYRFDMVRWSYGRAGKNE